MKRATSSLPAALDLDAPERSPRRATMTVKSTLIGVTAIAIALTSFDLRLAVAAPEGGPAIVNKNAGVDEISAARKRRYRGNPAVPLAAFGILAGTIASIAAANAQREYYDSYYRAPGYYGGPAYGYYGGGYAGPPAYQYAPVYHSRPVFQHRGYYGNAGGQQGDALPPPVSTPSLGGSN
jgi:hypothetical protein